MAALIELPCNPSEDYWERYKRVTDMSLDQDTVKNLNYLTPEQHRKVRNIIRWQRIGCIVVKISETLNVSLKEAHQFPNRPSAKTYRNCSWYPENEGYLEQFSNKNARGPW